MSSLNQNLGLIIADNTTTTTFSNPVYELESTAAANSDQILSSTLSNAIIDDKDKDGAQTSSNSSRFSTMTTHSGNSSTNTSLMGCSPIKTNTTSAFFDELASPTNSLRQRPEPSFNIIGKYKLKFLIILNINIQYNKIF